MLFQQLFRFVVLAVSVGKSNASIHRRHDSKHWVDTWVSMPQLTEPANLPPPPFVSFFAQYFNMCLIRVHRTKQEQCS